MGRFSGISYVLGGFFAGFLIHERLIGEGHGHIAHTFSHLNRGFFVPLFFGIAGLGADFSFRDPALIMALLTLMPASVLPGVLLTYFAANHIFHAKRLDDSPREVALILGGRGAVGVAIITIGLRNGLVDQATYSVVILSTAIISLLVLLFLRRKLVEKSLTHNEKNEP